jgi:hypothetical protein
MLASDGDEREFVMNDGTSRVIKCEAVGNKRWIESGSHKCSHLPQLAKVMGITHILQGVQTRPL